jgi:hypothetical protein
MLNGIAVAGGRRAPRGVKYYHLTAIDSQRILNPGSLLLMQASDYKE